MFERYTERARRTLFFARYEASQQGAIGIAPVHLLLGILREPSEVRARLFEQSGTAFDALKADVDRAAAATAAAKGHVDIPFTPATRRVLGAAAEWADRLLHQSIDNEHLLLGVIAVADPLVEPILTRHGVNLDALRQLLVERGDSAVADSAHILERARARSSPPPADALVFAVHISRSEGTGHESTRGTNHGWRLDGFLLRSALAKCCGDSDFDFPFRRVEIDSRFDTTSRFDFHVRGVNLRRTTEKELILKGIEEYFGATIVREHRTVDAYVLTAPDGVSGLPQLDAEAGIASGFASFGIVAEDVALDTESITDPSDLASQGMIGGMSGESISPAMLCYMLEMMLGRPVVDETGLTGQLDIHLEDVIPVTRQDFFDRFHRATGLQIVEAPRAVPFVAMRTWQFPK